MRLTAKKKKYIQQKILDWYAENQRDLPWRKTKNPYHILVSEIMLQQTQVDRVIPYYERWLQRFPTFGTLARAKKRTVLAFWSGLGYNNRGIRLQQLAKAVSKKYNEQLPSDEQELLSLPGIGPYTAHAIMAFAFNIEVPVIDTNIRRVIIHELGLDEKISSKVISKIALDLVPGGKSCLWHNALMDYGALILTSRKTGIKPMSKQSAFKGSERWVRGQIVKALVSEKTLPVERLEKLFPHNNFANIIKKMESEGILHRKENAVFL